MSDRPGPPDAGSLPPASVDITAMRRTVDAAATAGAGGPPVRATVLAAVGLLLLVAAVVALTATVDLRIAIAVGVAVLLAGTALIFVLPVQLARRRSRMTVEEVTATIDDAVSRVIRRLASIGYAIPDEVALDWVSSPVPTQTVPLVHDSVIAARWWRPAEGDDRVFVEAILRQDGRDSALPSLEPLRRA